MYIATSVGIQPGCFIWLSHLCKHKINLFGEQCISIVKELVNPRDVAVKGANVSPFTRQLGFSRIISLILRAQTFKESLCAIEILAIVQCVCTVHEVINISCLYYYREKNISGLQMDSISPANHRELSSV